MNLFSVTHAQAVLSAGYVICFAALNAVVLLISLFYRKKLMHPSPRWGFLAAIVLSLLYCMLLFGGRGCTAIFEKASLLFLGGGAFASIVNTAGLFSVMRKVRK
jgi:hypothetical protein